MDFRHRHVFRAHHHCDVTAKAVGRNLLYGVAPCGASFWANNVIFELRAISDEVDGRAFREWIIRAHYRHWNLVRPRGVGQTDDGGFVHTPPLEMRQFKSRG